MIVTIKKGENVKKVTKGAYDNLYRSLGFEILNEKKPKEVKEVKEVKETVISEKPEFVKKEKVNETK